MHKNTSIVIIGAGIGGLTMACALYRQGYQPLVFERTAKIQPIGAGIILSANAMAQLNKLDLAQTILQQGRPITNVSIQNQYGKCLSSINQSKVQQQYSFPSVAISRSALHNIILSSLPDQCVQLAHEFNAINFLDQHNTQVKFANGYSIQADIVIGADGINSQLRAAVLGKYLLRHSGQTCYRALAASSKETHKFFESWGNGKRFGAVPISQEQVYWYAVLENKQNNIQADDKVNMSLEKLFNSWHQPISELISATPAIDIIHTDIYDAIPTKKWFKNNVVFLGDAIHPTTPNLGQGASMAIESAVTLASSMSKYENTEAAFIHYQQQRQAYTARITKQSGI
jgi:2-polyprenyl-6-methoxyphenol hydroxylase-like FAD-dependent oxidoreductase